MFANYTPTTLSSKTKPSQKRQLSIVQSPQAEPPQFPLKFAIGRTAQSSQDLNSTQESVLKIASLIKFMFDDKNSMKSSKALKNISNY